MGWDEMGWDETLHHACLLASLRAASFCCLAVVLLMWRMCMRHRQWCLSGTR